MASLKRIFERTWLTAFVLAALVFIIVVFKDDRDKLARLTDADWSLLTAAALAQFMYFCVTVVTWRKVLRLAAGRLIGFSEGLVQILLVNFGKYIPGKVWGLAARGKRLNESGITLEEVGRASYLEQALLLLVGFWLAFISAAVVFGDLVYWAALLLVTLAILLFRHGDVILRKVATAFPRDEVLARAIELRLELGDIHWMSKVYIVVWFFLAINFIMVSTALIDV